MAANDPRPDDARDGLADSEDVLDFSDSAEQGGAVIDDLFDFDEILAGDDSPAEVDIDEILADLPGEDVDEERPAVETPSAASASRPTATIEPAASAPTEEPASPATPPTVGRGVVRRTGILLVSFTVLNLALIGFTWKMSHDVRTRVDAATVDIIRASRDIQEHTGEQAEMIQSVQAPVVSPEPEGAETFRRAQADLDAGDHDSARRRLYALLSISGRLSEDVRDDVVAHARFMLADSLFLQAMDLEPSDTAEGDTR